MIILAWERRASGKQKSVSMPVQRIERVKVTGMAAAVPIRAVEVGAWNSFKSEAERTKYIEQVGIDYLLN